MSDQLGRGYGKLYLSGRDDRVGQLAHVSLVDGRGNALVGLRAGEKMSLAGGNCTFVGSYAGHTALADTSTFIGAYAGRTAQRIENSVFVGYQSGELAQRIENTTMLGARTGRKMKRANNNTVVGYASGAELTSGSRNCMIGSYAGYKQYSASDNVAIGFRAAYNNQIGSDNVFVGSDSGYSAYASFRNVCLGVGSGKNLSTGEKNVLCGYLAGNAISGASNCIAIGTQAMEFFNDGDTNTCIGTGTARHFTGTNNTIVGGYSTANAAGDYNTIVGSRSMNRRTGERVNLSNCVIVGENIQFDIPIRRVTANVASLDQVPDAQLGNDSGSLILTDADDSFPNSTAFLLLNFVPVGDPVLIRERFVELGSITAPVAFDCAEQGQYDVAWGSSPNDDNVVMTPAPIRLRILVHANLHVQSSLTVYEKPVQTWTFAPTAALHVFVAQAFDPPSITAKFRRDEATAWDEEDAFDAATGLYLPGIRVPIERSALVTINGEVTVYASDPIDVVVLGMEFQMLESAIDELNGVWRVKAIDALYANTTPIRFDTGIAFPAEGLRDLGTTARFLLSRPVVAHVQGVYVAPDERIDIVEPALAGTLVGTTSSPVAYVDGTGDINEGVYPVVVANAFAGEFGLVIAEALDTAVDVGNVTISTFEPLICGFSIDASGPDKKVVNFSVAYSQRSDTGLQVNEFKGPQPFDGHRHRGAGSLAEMDLSIREGFLLFTDAGYSAADYTVGSLNNYMLIGASFSIPDTSDLTFGVEWLGTYAIACRSVNNVLDAGVTYRSGGETTTIASLSDDSVGFRGEFSGSMWEETGTVKTLASGEFPIDVYWVRQVVDDNPGNSTMWVDVSVFHYLKDKELAVTMTLTAATDGYSRSAQVTARLTETLPANQFSGLVSFYATGATAAYNITINNANYKDYPTFSDCIFLGSNFTVGGDEAVIDKERSNVCIAAIGTTRLFRGRREEFRFFSNVVVAPTVLVEGLLGSDETAATVIYGNKIANASSTSNALYVSGEVNFGGDFVVRDGNVTLTTGSLGVVVGNVSVGNALTVQGVATLGDTLTVDGVATFQENVTVRGTSELVGDVDMANSLAVEGSVTMRATLAVSGGTTLQDTLLVGGRVDVSDSVYITQGDLYVDGVSLESRFNVVENEIQALDGRLDTAENDINAVEGRVSDTEQRLDGAEGRLDTVENDINAVEGRVSGTEGDIAALESSVSVLNSDIDGVQQDIAGINAELDTKADVNHDHTGVYASMLSTNSGGIAFTGGVAAGSITASSGSIGGRLTVSGDLEGGRVITRDGGGSGTNAVITAGGRICLETSSARYKANIAPMPPGMVDTFWKLQPVCFNYRPGYVDAGDDVIRHGGFIAEQLDAVGFVEGVVYKDGAPEALRATAITALTVGAVQQLRDEMDVMRNEIATLREQIARIN